MKMIADRNGGRLVPMTEQDLAQKEKAIKDHGVRQLAEKAADKLEQEAFDALTGNLSPEHKKVLRSKFQL